MDSGFKLVAPFTPAGDQPAAIDELVRRVDSGERSSVLLGVTGSGKTYTIANLIARTGRPAIIMSPNKILAAQLYAEFKAFFPHNAVEYFISYYDYYQPEAYVPQTDMYIEKDAAINDHIDRLRLKATTALLERRDVIVVASVSCIYNIGSPQEYRDLSVPIVRGACLDRRAFLRSLVDIHYTRNDLAFARGSFRVRGETIEIFPAYLETGLRVAFDGDRVEALREFNPLTGEVLSEREKASVYPAKHFVTTPPRLEAALGSIEAELKLRLAELNANGKLLEAQRLDQRTRYDMEMLRETGFCSGVENYSRHLAGRGPGERPLSLIDYFSLSGHGKDFLTIIDESHIGVSQIRAMYEGDRSRKQTLVDFGFRLPSALDNRPLTFKEFESIVGQTVYVSATPGPYELKKTGGEIVDLVIRPTGLVDPEIDVRPVEGQIDDLMREIAACAKLRQRVLVTTLTKRMSEDLTEYLAEKGMRVQYLHSEIDTLERVEILHNLRRGDFDVLVGINLLREGLDLPEVALVAVLDADKEGFLRSETTLIQICGRAARNAEGRIIFYADRVTGSMQRAMDEMSRRREKQKAFNSKNGITPRTIIKAVQKLDEFQYNARTRGLAEMVREIGPDIITQRDIPGLVRSLEDQMRSAADSLDFESAAVFRDRITELREMGATGSVRSSDKHSAKPRRSTSRGRRDST